MSQVYYAYYAYDDYLDSFYDNYGDDCIRDDGGNVLLKSVLDMCVSFNANSDKIAMNIGKKSNDTLLQEYQAKTEILMNYPPSLSDW